MVLSTFLCKITLCMETKATQLVSHVLVVCHLTVFLLTLLLPTSLKVKMTGQWLSLI